MNNSLNRAASQSITLTLAVERVLTEHNIEHSAERIDTLTQVAATLHAANVQQELSVKLVDAVRSCSEYAEAIPANACGLY